MKTFSSQAFIPSHLSVSPPRLDTSPTYSRNRRKLSQIVQSYLKINLQPFYLFPKSFLFQDLSSYCLKRRRAIQNNGLLSSPGLSPSPSPCPNRPPSWIKVSPKKKNRRIWTLGWHYLHIVCVKSSKGLTLPTVILVLILYSILYLLSLHYYWIANKLIRKTSL